MSRLSPLNFLGCRGGKSPGSSEQVNPRSRGIRYHLSTATNTYLRFKLVLSEPGPALSVRLSFRSLCFPLSTFGTLARLHAWIPGRGEIFFSLLSFHCRLSAFCSLLSALCFLLSAWVDIHPTLQTGCNGAASTASISLSASICNKAISRWSTCRGLTSMTHKLPTACPARVRRGTPA